MKVKGCRLASCELKFKRPFEVSKTVLSKRNILYIKIETEEGFFSYGEASPLPQFGSEAFEESQSFLETIGSHITGKDFPDVNSIELYLNSITPPPAARFALEEVLLLALSHNDINKLASLLNFKAQSAIKINAALGFISYEEYIPKITGLIGEGYSTFKIKIGRNDFNEDLRILKILRDHFGNEIILRADVNGKWTLDEAIENISKIDGFNLEYIEQPVNSLADFIALKEKVKTPLAVDESIRSLKDAGEFIETGAVDYIVLKPALTGGIIPCIEIIKKANGKSIKTVLSSSFETQLGAVPSLLLASSLDRQLAHGFGVLAAFENNLLDSTIELSGGQIRLANINIPVLYSLLENNFIFKHA